VERVLRSIDSVLLIVDAQEGPMPQTRFVLKKSLELGLKPIVVLNKIDKPAADPARAEEQVLELFFELGATDAQANFPVVYAIGRDGVAGRTLNDMPSNGGASMDLSPLLDVILEHVPPASSPELLSKPAKLQAFSGFAASLKTTHHLVDIQRRTKLHRNWAIASLQCQLRALRYELLHIDAIDIAETHCHECLLVGRASLDRLAHTTPRHPILIRILAQKTSQTHHALQAHTAGLC
jgi:hypothetical protein